MKSYEKSLTVCPALSRLFFCLTLCLVLPSIRALHRALGFLMILTSPTVVHAYPASDHARRALGKRDVLADSEFSSSSWIWLPEPDLPKNAPPGAVAFTKTFATPAGKTAFTALIAITVDDSFTL